MRSSNPVLSRSDAFTRGGYATFDTTVSDREFPRTDNASAHRAALRTGQMTLEDVVTKTVLTLLTLVVAAGLTWVTVPATSLGIPLIAALVGFGLAMVVTFKRMISPPLILAYAAAEGVFLGGLSHFLNDRYPGIAVQAVLGTAAAFAGMLIAYRSGKIRVTPRFTKMVVGATIGFFVLMLINTLCAAFKLGGPDGLGFTTGGLGLLLGIAGVVLATLFLALDFDMVEQGIRNGAPERESWLAAFGLTVTLVWLYSEILRLLAILREE